MAWVEDCQDAEGPALCRTQHGVGVDAVQPLLSNDGPCSQVPSVAVLPPWFLMEPRREGLVWSHGNGGPNSSTMIVGCASPELVPVKHIDDSRPSSLVARLQPEPSPLQLVIA